MSGVIAQSNNSEMWSTGDPGFVTDCPGLSHQLASAS